MILRDLVFLVNGRIRLMDLRDLINESKGSFILAKAGNSKDPNL